MKTKKLIAFVLAAGFFYIVGIQLNILLICDVFNNECSLFFQKGDFTIFAIFAGCSAIIARKIYKVLC